MTVGSWPFLDDAKDRVRARWEVNRSPWMVGIFEHSMLMCNALAPWRNLAQTEGIGGRLSAGFGAQTTATAPRHAVGILPGGRRP
jgi:hypothetical protein